MQACIFSFLCAEACAPPSPLIPPDNTDMAAESFFRRWARRKAESAATVSSAENDADKLETETPRLPGLDDVARLTAESDYSLFVAKGIDTAVQRAAMKKLFSDPHFNTMDGLDIYIGDYTRASPLSATMRSALKHAQNLFAPLPVDDKESRIETASTGEPELSQDGDPAPHLQSDGSDCQDSSPDACSS